MPEIPQVRQSLRPSWGVGAGLVAVLLVMAVIACRRPGRGQDCRGPARNSAESRCR